MLARIQEDDSSSDGGFTNVRASAAEEALSEAKAAWETTKLRACMLKEVVSGDISELSDLLDKLNTDAATTGRGCGHQTSRVHCGKAVLEAEPTVKTLALKTAAKEKAVSSVIHNVCSAESVYVALFWICTGSIHERKWLH